MFNENDIEEPASVIVTNVEGRGYDIKNIPGFKRKQLIESGELSINSFVHADNMPGAKLQKMREKFAKANGDIVPSAPLVDINSLSEGSLVEYRKTVTEVKKININKGLVYLRMGKKDGWINVAKLKPVTIPPDNDEE